MQSVSIIGHIGADAESYSNNGRNFLRFRVAVSRQFTDRQGAKHEETQWFTCFYSGGDAIRQYLVKGQMVYVSGSLTLSVVSSPKLRRMVVAADVSVQQIELVGNANRDDVPRRLIDCNGALHDVYKAYFIREQNMYNSSLYDTRGGVWRVDQYGFLSPDVQSAAGDASAASASGSQEQVPESQEQMQNANSTSNEPPF